MPKSDKDVGHGYWTGVKIRDLKSVLRWHLAVTHNVIDNNGFAPSYHYIDCTAGPGVGATGIDGSPLVFLDVARSCPGLFFDVDLIEQHAENIQSLQAEIEARQARKAAALPRNLRYQNGRYEDLLLPVAKASKSTYGLMFVDTSGNIPAFDVISEAIALQPRKEVLIYISASAIKRAYAKQGMLQGYLDEMGKKRWFVRKPLKGDHYQWTFLFGTNADSFSDYKKVGFHLLGSKEAKGYFPKLNLTKRQYKESKQPPLF